MELALRILLGAVLAWAAIAKLRTFTRLASSLAEHGAPPRLRTPLAAVLIAVELTLAVALLAGLWLHAAGIAVALLGGLFALSLIRLRSRGKRRTSCGCFGSTRQANTALLTVRALVLGAAGAVIAAGLPATANPTGDVWRTIGLIALGTVVTVLTLAVLALYRQVGVLAQRLGPRTALELEDEGPPVGQSAPLLAGLTRRGTELVAFVSLECRMCIEIVPGLRALQREGIPVHWLREDRDEETFELWGVPGTPYVVHVIDGVVRAKGLVNTLEQVDWVLDVGTERSRRAA